MQIPSSRRRLRLVTSLRDRLVRRRPGAMRLLSLSPCALIGAAMAAGPAPLAPVGSEGTVAPLLSAHLVAGEGAQLVIEVGLGDGVPTVPGMEAWEVLVVEPTPMEFGSSKDASTMRDLLRGARVLRRVGACPGDVLTMAIPHGAFGAVERVGVLLRAGDRAHRLASGGQPALSWASIALPPQDPSTALAAPPAPGAILVTEFMKDPAAVSDTRGEWLELENRTGEAIDIEGWTLRDDGSNHTVITATTSGAGVIVPAGGFAVLGRNADMAVNGGVVLDATYTGFTLGNGADQIVLEAPGGHLVDRVDYEDGTGDWPDTAGASVSLSPRFAGTSVAVDGAAWCSGVDPMPAGDFGSPGVRNGECQ